MNKILGILAFFIIFGAQSSFAKIDISQPTLSGNFVYFDVRSDLKFRPVGDQNLVVTLSTGQNVLSAIALTAAEEEKRKVVPNRCVDCQGMVNASDGTYRPASATYPQRKKMRLVISIADMCMAGGVQTDSFCLNFLNPDVHPATLTKTLYVTIGLANDRQSIGPIFGVNGSDTTRFTLTLKR